MEIFGNSDMKEATPLKTNMLDSFAPASLTKFIFNRITKAAFEKETEEVVLPAQGSGKLSLKASLLPFMLGKSLMA